MSSVNDNFLEALVEMSFERSQAVEALRATNNSGVEAAIEYIFSLQHTTQQQPVQHHLVQRNQPTSLRGFGSFGMNMFEQQMGEDDGDYSLIPTDGTELILDIPYRDQFHEKHHLDVHKPQDVSSLKPVVVHVHGGGWQRGDRSQYFYGAPFIGQAMAKRGYVCVTVSYRTDLPFPVPVQDVAAALKWVKDCIEPFGGDPNNIFLSGHSAGGHLVSLLATDHQYLQEHKLDYTAIRGVISISGIYTVGNPLSDDVNSMINSLYRMVYVLPVFGDVPASWNAASPWHHITYMKTKGEVKVPPFLLFNAENDLGLDHDGQRFWTNLMELGAKVDYKLIKRSTHATITRSDIVADHCKEFIESILQSQAKNP